MKITNKYELPESYWRACAQQRTVTPGRISVTELLQPPQMRFLLRQHDHELEVDCADMLELFFGNAVHFYLEQFAPSRGEAEVRIEWQDPETGWTVHGTPDLHEVLTFSDGTLIDWKTTRVRALQYDREEWKQQVNLYAHLLRLNGHRVSSATAWIFCKDYDPQKRGDDGYPSHGIAKIPIELWPEEQAADFLGRRLRLHDAGIRGMYGPCSDRERWMRATHAVMKHDGRRAAAVFDHEAQAIEYIEAAVEEPKNWRDWYRIDYRPGAPARCQSWCVVREVCPQWAAERPDTLLEQLEASIT